MSREMRVFEAGSQRKRGGFTLVELLVVVAIIVALAAASVVAVGRFAGKGEEGARASEKETVQAAMDAMMAEAGTTSVTANDLTTISNGVQDFSSLPTQGALAPYMRKNPTVYFYCWDATGKVKQIAASGACPAGPY